MSSNLERQPDSGPEIERYRVLLELADLMVHRPTLPELFHELAQTLQKAISFDFINFSLYDPTTNTMRLRLWEGGSTPLFPPRCRWKIRPAGGSGKISRRWSSRICEKTSANPRPLTRTRKLLLLFAAVDDGPEKAGGIGFWGFEGISIWAS